MTEGPDSSGVPASSTGFGGEAPVVLANRYRLGARIGQGGRAVVFAARDLLLDREVAVKVFRARAVAAEELRVQEAEARVLAALNHYALTTLFDAGVTQDADGLPQLYLVMELIVGTTLRERATGVPMAALEFAFLGFDLMEGLASVHTAGYLHRDIKPANVLIPVKTGLRAMPGKLADFGIASLIGEPDLSEFTIGTAAYLSPEQVEGLDATAASDVYSLGLVLLETWTQKVEFPGGIEQSAYARLERDPRVPADMPAGLAAVLRAMTAFQPEDRPELDEAAHGFYDFITDEVVRIRMAAANTVTPTEERELKRIAVLAEYGLTVAVQDEVFARFARIAAGLADAPRGAICLFGADGNSFTATHGWRNSGLDLIPALVPQSGPATWSITDTALTSPQKQNDAARSPEGVRSAAGAMIVTHDGYTLGSVCVFDTVVREYSTVQLGLLTDLAESVLTEMELRRAMHRALLPDR